MYFPAYETGKTFQGKRTDLLCFFKQLFQLPDFPAELFHFYRLYIRQHSVLQRILGMLFALSYYARRHADGFGKTAHRARQFDGYVFAPGRRDFDALRRMVPETTLDYLRSAEGLALAERLGGATGGGGR